MRKNYNLKANKGKILFALFLMTCSLIVTQGQVIKGTWTSISGIPTARWFPGTDVLDGKIYVIGGNEDASSAPLKNVEVYDPATDKWVSKTSLPVSRAQVSACALNGKIYVIGGSSGPSSWTPVAEVYIYDPLKDSWSKGTDMPNPRAELALVAFNNKIYAIGGITSSSSGSKSVDVYDPATDSWTKGADMPTARGTMPACLLNGKIYVFGGTNGGASSWNHYSIMEVYDIASNTWTTKASMPYSRSHLSGCTYKNKIYALGGSHVNESISYSTVASYNPETDTWENEPSMSIAREAFNAVVLNEKIYVMGGTQMQNGLVALSNSEVYDTIQKVFISNDKIRLPAKKDVVVGKLFVPNSETLKFTYQLIQEGNSNLFKIQNDSLYCSQNFDLKSEKNYQLKVLAISENNDSVQYILKLSAYFQVDAVFSSPNGFLLKSSDKKVMLDVLTPIQQDYGFLPNSIDIYNNMKNGTAPFDNIDLIYSSHWHGCHFDPVLLFNAMKNNPNAISIMSEDVRSEMNKYFTDNPELLSKVYVPLFPVNTSKDTTIAGISMRLTKIEHESSYTLCINILLDSIRFTHFDDYNKLSAESYKTIGFTKLPTDVALLGSHLLDGDQAMVKETYSPYNYLTFSHIAFYTNTLFEELTAKSKTLTDLNYKVNILNWPMEMFSYKKVENKMFMEKTNNAPVQKRSFKNLTIEKNKETKLLVPAASFIDSDPNDKISYSFTIDDKTLPAWATYDASSQNMSLTPPSTGTYIFKITATDNHLSYASTAFGVTVTNSSQLESIETESKFDIYPVPAKNYITVESKKPEVNDYCVCLYTVNGDLLYSKNCQENKFQIDLSRFSSQVMLLVIKSKNNTEYHRVIK